MFVHCLTRGKENRCLFKQRTEDHLHDELVVAAGASGAARVLLWKTLGWIHSHTHTKLPSLRLLCSLVGYWSHFTSVDALKHASTHAYT